MNLNNKFIRSIFCFAFISMNMLSVWSQTVPKIQSFNLDDVKLLDSPFKQALELNKKYLLELDADRLLAPFLKEAGLLAKAENYSNWESSGLNGHIGGHYLSALALMYASTADRQIKERLDYMLNQLSKVQRANGNGYIGGVPESKKLWNEIAEGNINAGGFSLNDKWVPLYNIHKTYAGLRDAYIYAKNGDAKEMLIAMTDWMIKLVGNLSDAQIQEMLRSEHGGLNETFADVAAITGNDKYLSLAHRFSHHRILNPLLAQKDELTGLHANTQIPKVIGYKRIADLENNKDWSEAARFFWDMVVEDRSVCIGGNSVGEHFNSTDDFFRMVSSVEGPETCNTYNMLRLSKMLYETSADKKYMDYYEKALYNHILSSQDASTGGLVYFTPMKPGHYRVYSQPQTSMWCCVGSGIENHAKYGEMIFSHTDEELYVNLFIPAVLNWKDKQVEITQQNHFPEEAYTEIIINPQKKATSFELKLRVPSWLNFDELKIYLNGKSQQVKEENGYVSISKKWKKGDKIKMEMPMRISVEQLPDNSNYFAYFYGPIVLAAKYGTQDLKGLYADDSRGGHIAHGRQIPMRDIPVLIGNPQELPSLLQTVENKPLTFRLQSVYPSENNGFELIPFYKLHESRYIIYWAQTTENGFRELQQKIEQEEKEQLRLSAITVDAVKCGEQQPESDHFIRFEKSQTGFDYDYHWREARNWFSYEFRNPERNAEKIFVKYFSSHRLRSADILINGIKVGNIHAEKGKDNETAISIIEIPDNLRNSEQFKIEFRIGEKEISPKFIEIRIIKKDFLNKLKLNN
jgi:Uncharacterized protein conserved in bacteria